MYNRSMKKVVELNRPGLWKAIRNPNMSVRSYLKGYPYQENNILKMSDAGSEVYRYAKSFTKFKLDFSLFLFTHESDNKKIESFFNAIVKNLKKKEISETLVNASMSNFTYLDKLYGDKN